MGRNRSSCFYLLRGYLFWLQKLAAQAVSVFLIVLIISLASAAGEKRGGGVKAADAQPAVDAGSKMLFARTSFSEPLPSTEIYVANLDGTGASRLTNNNYAEINPSWSPDGTKILFSSYKDSRDNGSLRQSLYVMNADGTGVRRLTAGLMTSDDSPAWSPDGSKIAFSRTTVSQNKSITKISILDIDSGSVRTLGGSGLLLLQDRMPAWSPDGTKIAFSAYETTWPGVHVYVMDSDGNNARRLSPAPTDQDYSHYSPAWSPDGTKIAFASNTGISVINPDGTGLQKFSNNYTNSTGGLSWLPDGKGIAFSRYDAKGSDSFDIYVMMNADGTGIAPLIVSSHVNEGAPQYQKKDGGSSATVNLEERLNAIADHAEKLAADLASANIKFVDPLPPEIGHRKVAFVREDGPDPEIFLIDTDGGGLKKLTDDRSSGYNPDWSPDGRRIAFVSNHDTKSAAFQLYTINADGTDLRRLTNDPSYMDMNPAWSPDGKKIAFTRYLASGSGELFGRIAVVDAADGSNLAMLAGTGGGMDASPSWSPDGSMIAFHSFSMTLINGTYAGTEIFVMNADGTGARQLTRPVPGLQSVNVLPSWSPVDDRIVFMTREGIAVIDADDNDNNDEDAGSGMKLLVEAEWLGDPFWSPDGSKIIFTGPKGNYTRETGPTDFGLFIMDPDGTRIQGFLDDGDPAHREGDADLSPYAIDDVPQPVPPPPAANKDLFCGRPASGYDRIISGTEDDDTLFGTGGDDLIRGFGGDDAIFGNAGNDCLKGDDGNDIIWGGDGSDTLLGNSGNDKLVGDAGNDILNGNAGDDKVWGSDNDDVILGETGADLLIGDAGNDIIWGGNDDDRILGGEGNDTIYGDDGSDRLYGQRGDDRLLGGSSNDIIVGGIGIDVLIGDSGDDRAWGNAGNDMLYDDGGNDLQNGGSDNDTCYDVIGNNSFLNCEG